MSSMPDDLKEIQQLLELERARHLHDAPRSLREFESQLQLVIALSLAAVYEEVPINPRWAATHEPSKIRLRRLLEHDPMFHHLVKAQTVSVMRLLEDYAQATRMELR